MKSNFFFSIIIPTYNRKIDLERCLESLVTQTFKNFEVIVCDNGSTDNTREVVNKFEKKLHLTYIHIEKNSGGPAAPRNIGIKVANAEWICFLDSDDWYSENRLQNIANLDLEKTDFIYHSLNIIRNNKITGSIKSRNLSRSDAYSDLLFNLNAIPTSSTCIRKICFEKTGGFKEIKEINGLEDFDLWIRLAKTGVRFKYIPIVMGSYAFGEDNLTYNDERQINRFIALYKQFIDSETNKKRQDKIKSALNYLVGSLYVKQEDISKGYPLLISALKKGSIAVKLRSINMILMIIKTRLKTK